MSSTPLSFPDSWTNPGSPGYGTFPVPNKPQSLTQRIAGAVQRRVGLSSNPYAAVVATALDTGYRHIDTAQAYGNEKFVGEAIRESQIPREQIFLTSKLFPSGNNHAGALKGAADSKSALGLAPDMYLIHFPGWGSAIEAWKGLIEARGQGLCKRIGVSNFEINHLTTLVERTGELPALNQIEFHPHLWSDAQSKLVSFCRENKIAVEGFSPFAEVKSGLLENPAVVSAARTHNSTPTRVLLKWSMQHGVRPIFGSLSEKHIGENFGPYDFTLSPDEMSSLDALGAAQTRVSLQWGWNPPAAVLR